MKNDLTLVFMDIDGCIVQSFDGKGLNQAQYADKCLNQPLNKGVVENLLRNKKSNEYWYGLTGRKASIYKTHTENQLHRFIHSLCGIEDIIYYPEEYEYNPIDQYIEWKKNKIIELTRNYLPSKIIIIEDDWNVIEALTVQSAIHIPIEFWIVVDNHLLLTILSENIEVCL